MQNSNYPPMPYNPFPDLPVYQLTNGSFLLDDRSVDYPAWQQDQTQQRSFQAMAFDGPPPPPGWGDGLGDGGDSGTTGYVFSSTDLWLELASMTNAAGYFVVHTPETNGIYDLFLTTNLNANVPGLNLTNWLWVMRCNPGQTNLIVSNLTADQCFFMLGRTNDDDGDGLTTAFEHLVSHTNPTNADENANGIPDGWEWGYFGSLHPGTGDYDGDGVSNFAEYQAGTDPNTIDFTLAVTNRYVCTSPTPVQISPFAGVPASMAVLVDSTNFADASWVGYSQTVAVPIGSSEGWHQIWVGLRGRLGNSQQTWQTIRVKLDQTAPLLVVTNPVSTTISRPVIQLQGYCPEALAKQVTIINATLFVRKARPHPGPLPRERETVWTPLINSCLAVA